MPSRSRSARIRLAISSGRGMTKTRLSFLGMFALARGEGKGGLSPPGSSLGFLVRPDQAPNHLHGFFRVVLVVGVDGLQDRRNRFQFQDVFVGHFRAPFGVFVSSSSGVFIRHARARVKAFLYANS